MHTLLLIVGVPQGPSSIRNYGRSVSFRPSKIDGHQKSALYVRSQKGWNSSSTKVCPYKLVRIQATLITVHSLPLSWDFQVFGSLAQLYVFRQANASRR